MPISGPLRAVSSLLDSLLASEPAIAPDRVVITGLSMGGYGTLDLSARRPGTFAAALAICGGGPAPQAAAGVYGQLPLWLFHGDADNIVPVSGSRDMVDALLTAGARVRYREYPGAGHDTWTSTYTDPAVVQWLLSRVRGGPVAGNQAPSLAVGPASLNLDLPVFTYTPPTVLSDPDGGPSPIYVWWYPVSGPGRPLFTPQDGGGATALFPRVGTYRLRASADDGSHHVSREIVVHVRPPGGGAMPALLGHWTFDEGAGLDVHDATGHSAPGRLLTAGSWITDTPDGSPSALRFNSPGNVVRIPASPWLSPSNNRFSLTFWAKVTWDGFLFRQFGAWDLGTAGGLRLTFLDKGNGAWFQPGAPAGSAGRWTHLAFTYDGSIGRFYFDGNLAHTRDAEDLVLNASTSPLLIGGQTWNADRDDAEHIQGALDDVRLYDAPLTVEQIRALATPGIAVASAPTVSPAAGSYADSVTVTLATSTVDAAIRYTTNGTEPTETSALYSAPLTFTATTTLRARAFKPGFTASSTTVAAYTVTVATDVATPTVSPAAGSYPGSVAVTLATATSGAALRYTLDGSTPTATSPLYTAPLWLSANTTVKARGFKSGLTASPVATAAYTVTITTPGGGNPGGGAPGELPAFTESLLPGTTPTTSNGDNDNGYGRVAIGDINGDGQNDIITHSWGGVRDVAQNFAGVHWFRYPDFTRFTVDSSSSTAFFGDTVLAQDVDGDGDIDIVGVKGNESTFQREVWYENTAGDGSAWTERTILDTNFSYKETKSMLLADMDGDGKLDLVTRRETRLYVCYQDSKTSWTNAFQTVASRENMGLGDLDGDGRTDVILNGYWLRNDGTRNVGSWTRYNFDSEWYGKSGSWDVNAVKVHGGDLDGDGRSDIVVTHSEQAGWGLYWYKLTGDHTAGPSAWTRRTIDADVPYAHTLQVHDLNHDGLLDIVTGTNDGEGEKGGPATGTKVKGVYAYINRNNAASWDEVVVSRNHWVYSAIVGDVGSDGSEDIVSPVHWQRGPVVYWQNDIVGSPAVTYSLEDWTRLQIGTFVENAIFVEHADLNGDGRLDLVSGSDWWQQPAAGLAGTWTRRAIGGNFLNHAIAHDFDGDGDIDLLGTTGEGANASRALVWARNNGTGSFEIRNIGNAPGNGDFLQGRVLAALKGGQKQVVFSWHNGGGGLHALTVPADPVNQTWTFSTLSATTLKEDLDVGDIDGDGDLDLLLGTIWLENTATGWTSRTLGSVANTTPAEGNTPEPDRCRLADIDGDGDLDAVIANEYGRDIVWFENSGPAAVTGTWIRRLVGTAHGQGFSMDVHDLDNDGRPDVVLGEHRGDVAPAQNNRVLIFRNVGGGASWTTHVVDSDSPSVIDHHDGTQVADLDGDGDPDIYSIGWNNQKLWVFRNDSPTIPTSGGGPLPTVATPVIAPAPGEHASPLTVTLSTPTAGAQLRYSADPAADLATAGQIYSAPFALTLPATLRVQAFKAGELPSAVVQASYTAAPGGPGPDPEPVSGWAFPTLDHRLPLTLTNGPSAVLDQVTTAELDFTAALAALGASGPFAPASLRVVELNAAGTAATNLAVPFQFDPAADYDASSRARGTLVFTLTGNTAASAVRRYHVYFDTGAGHTAATAPTARVAVTATASTYEGQAHHVFTQEGATLWFDNTGGGFSRLIDRDGRDWITFRKRNPGQSGWFRGLPNLGYPGNLFHPGYATAATTLVSSGPLRIVFDTATTDGVWRLRWSIYPDRATLSVLQKDATRNFWFLYEGTPGGQVDLTTDFTLRPDGTRTPLGTAWSTVLPAAGWIGVEDSVLGRSLLLVQHEADTATDSSYVMETGDAAGENMTVISFGRAGEEPVPLIGATPRTFTLSLRDTAQFSALSAAAAGYRAAPSIVLAAPQDRTAAPAATSRGTPHAWLLTHYPTAIDLEAIDALDTDGDGFATWQEHITATDPTDPASLIQVRFSELAPARVLEVWPALGDGSRAYFLDRASTPTLAAWIDVEATLELAGDTLRLTDPAPPAPPVFYRVRVALP